MNTKLSLVIIVTALAICKPKSVSDGNQIWIDRSPFKEEKEMQFMKTGENGLALIREYEGLRLEAYRCPSGNWTIGYGHTRGVKEEDRITPEEAEHLLLEDVALAEAIINRECTGLNQNQFDALVSFVMNVGEGNFCRSTLLKCVKANPNNPNIRNEISRWNKSGGMILAGLLRRRRAEVTLYFKE